MLLMSSFLSAILFIMVSPSLALDGSRGKQSAGDMDGIREYLYNSQRRSFKPKVSPSQDVDDMRKVKDVKRVKDVRGFENVQRQSKLASACYCGITSVKCCRAKRILSKIGEVRSSFAVPKADFVDEPMNERLQREDRRH